MESTSIHRSGLHQEGDLGGHGPLPARTSHSGEPRAQTANHRDTAHIRLLAGPLGPRLPRAGTRQDRAAPSGQLLGSDVECRFAVSERGLDGPRSLCFRLSVSAARPATELRREFGAHRPSPVPSRRRGLPWPCPPAPCSRPVGPRPPSARGVAGGSAPDLRSGPAVSAKGSFLHILCSLCSGPLPRRGCARLAQSGAAVARRAGVAGQGPPQRDGGCGSRGLASLGP
mmetsp:Transcript_125136/g.400809  ORF Transcript_125136/g.400809 Transcript_125136/m.400809 type:complete len:228 (+) Transcript_125136:852-1535(+)